MSTATQGITILEDEKAYDKNPFDIFTLPPSQDVLICNLFLNSIFKSVELSANGVEVKKPTLIMHQYEKRLIKLYHITAPISRNKLLPLQSKSGFISLVVFD